jgi:hypothetical protein
MMEAAGPAGRLESLEDGGGPAGLLGLLDYTVYFYTAVATSTHLFVHNSVFIIDCGLAFSTILHFLALHFLALHSVSQSLCDTVVMLIPCVSVSAVMLLVCVCALLQVPLAHSLTRSLSLPHEEVSALHDLFDSTGGPSGGWAWKNESEFGVAWNFSQANDGSYLHDPCVDWQGVKCISVSGSASAGEAGAGRACNTTRALDQDQGEGEEVHCRIVMLNLFEYNLTGSVPSSLGFALSRLQELTLWRNVLSSSIPSSLGLLTDLVLLDFDETG